MSAKDNPAEIDRQKKSDDKTDEKDDSAANSDTFGGEEKTMMDEIDMVLPGSKPLENLDVSQVGPATYRVMSARNGGVTSHKVNVAKGTCECGDKEYNKTDKEACAHLAKALLAHPARMTPQESAMWSVMQAQDNVYTIEQKAEDLFDKLEDKRIQQLSNGTESSDESQTEQTEQTEQKPEKGQPVRNPSGKSSGEPAVDPMEAAEKLQSAFDDVVADMQTEVEGGDVWIQTGRNTPDTLPGPGNVEVFNAFLKNPEQVTYDPDAAEAGQSPGKWWKNRIDPQDVDSYIQEVLK